MSIHTKYPKQTKYRGVRETASGKYEISFYPYKGAKKKEQKTVEAGSPKEASDKRLAMLFERRKANQVPEEQRDLLSSEFNKVRQDLLDGLFNKEGKPLPEKTRSKYKHVFDRMFVDFRKLKHPNLNNPGQLSLRFLEEYRNYFCGVKENDKDVYHLGRERGWRGEVIMVKAILRRCYRLGYVKADLILKVKEEIHRPKPNKTHYNHLSDSQMKDILSAIKIGRPDFWNLARFQNATGRRVEECTRIEKTDVVWGINLKLEKLNIRSETTKMQNEAPIWISADLEEIVRCAYNNSSKHKAPYLFLTRRNRKINQRDYNDYLRKVSKEVTGIEITTKYFRKRFMTECQRRGVALKDAMAVSGLQDEEVALQHYSNTTKEGQQKALEAMRLE